MILGDKEEYLSYTDICDIAKVDPKKNPTITVAYKHTLRDTCDPQHKVKGFIVQDGMVINCMICGDA